MNKKVVESRNYKYLIFLIIQIFIFFGVVKYAIQQHSKLSNISDRYYRKMSQISPDDRYWLGQYAEFESKVTELEWNFLITFVVIIVFYIIISILLLKNCKNESEKLSLVIWIGISVILLIYAGNGNLHSELFDSEFITQLLFLFISIPLIIKTIFGTFIGKQILESELKIKQSINSNNSKIKELNGLLESGIITKEEYREKSENLNKDIISNRIENDKEFIEIKSKLSQAVKSGLIEQKVAETKIIEFREKLLRKKNK